MNALGFLIANDGLGDGHMGGGWGWMVIVAMVVIVTSPESRSPDARWSPTMLHR